MEVQSTRKTYEPHAECGWLIPQAYDHIPLVVELCTVLEQTGCSQVWRQTARQSSASYSAPKTYKASKNFPDVFVGLVAFSVYLYSRFISVVRNQSLSRPTKELLWLVFIKPCQKLFRIRFCGF
jgi:hypothetical protein